MNYENCLEMVAKKYGLGKTLVTGHKASYFKEAAEMYKRQYVTELNERNSVDEGEKSFACLYAGKERCSYECNYCKAKRTQKKTNDF